MIDTDLWPWWEPQYRNEDIWFLKTQILTFAKASKIKNEVVNLKTVKEEAKEIQKKELSKNEQEIVRLKEQYETLSSIKE